MKNIWKNIAIWTTMTAAAIAGSIPRTTQYQKSIPENTREAQVSTDTGLAKTLTPANQTLQNFPEQIPGAESVKKYMTPGATKTIVHLRQIHDGAFESFEDIFKEVIDYKVNTDPNDPAEAFGQAMEYIGKLSRSSNRWKEVVDLSSIINDNQRDAYHIIGDLKDKGIIDKVYSEGLTVEDAKEVEEVDKNYQKGIYDLKLLALIEKGYLSPASKNLHLGIVSLENFLSRYEGRQDSNDSLIGTEFYRQDQRLAQDSLNELLEEADSYRFIPGAEKLHAKDGNITLIPAETRRARKLGKLSRDTALSTEYIKDNREDVLLDIASKSKDNLVLTIYGGDHAWAGKNSFPNYNFNGRDSKNRDNIAEWNKENPNKKFSLIEITPENYESLNNYMKSIAKDIKE